MKIDNINQIIESKELRDKAISRIDILDKVGQLLLIGNTEFATKHQIATYYGVKVSAIESIERRNRDELISDGYKNYKKSEIENLIGQVDRLEIANRGMNLFTKRAILRVGMLLRDSEIAKEIRSRLLDVFHDASELKRENGNTIVEEICLEIDTEKELQYKIGKAYSESNINDFAKYSMQLNNLKNKRVKELELINKNITTNALTIIESRAVINKLIREIASVLYPNKGPVGFGMAFNKLYEKVNYKLHINVRNRLKKKNQSLLDTLKDDELKQVELMVRAWGQECGLNLNEILSIC